MYYIKLSIEKRWFAENNIGNTGFIFFDDILNSLKPNQFNIFSYNYILAKYILFIVTKYLHKIYKTVIEFNFFEIV
ncbi:hypothetical protein SDC9_159135 [bioreactor metagenome]|uniref:Uncharacterized protein n=1 Tax=bioreactor metagenome TaxID=1076179 RepID=A0A645FC24_9ZZZZ